jgi:hypothetical protein
LQGIAGQRRAQAAMLAVKQYPATAVLTGRRPSAFCRELFVIAQALPPGRDHPER